MRIWVIASAICCAAAALASATEVDASIRKSTSIPAQALEPALHIFAKERDLQVVYRSEVVGNLQTAGATGELTANEALKQLLSGTGLTFQYLDDRTVTIVPAASGAAPAGNGKPVSSQLMDNAKRMRLAQARSYGAGSETLADATPGDDKQSAEGQAEGAQSGKLEEVVVTATRREQRLQDVPVSIAVLTADDINRRGLVGAADYLRGIPGVNQVDGAAVGGQAIVIRGIEANPAYQNFQGGPNAATYFGETPTTGSAGLGGSNVDIKLVDVERVEILRGPQGTAFGNSSMGGAVRTIPVAPKLDTFEGKFGAGYSSTSGSGGTNYQFQGVGNIPLVEGRLAIRGTAYTFSDSGYYVNRAGSDAAFQAAFTLPFQAQAFATDEDEVGAYRSTGGRLAALFQATDDLRFTLSYLTQKNETDGLALATSGTYEQTLGRVAPEHVHRGQNGGLSDSNVDIANAVMEYNLGWADLLATYSHVKGGTATSTPYTGFNLLWAASTDLTTPFRGNVGEIRLVTKLKGAWNFLAGLYHEKTYDDYYWDAIWYSDPSTNFLVPGQRFLYDYRNRRDLTQKAAFAEVSWEFLPRLTLTAGARAYDYDRDVRVDQTGPLWGADSHDRNAIQDSGVTGRANLSYKLNDSTLLYAGWAQGFRLGQSGPGVPANLCDLDNNGLIDGTNVTIESTKTVDSDSIDSYEIGGKLSALDRRLTIDAALFRMEWQGIPVSVGHPGCSSTYLANAGEARSEGVELQANFQLTEAVRVDVGGSWIKAELTKDVPVQGFVAGMRLPGSPKSSANLGLQYAFGIAGHAAFVRADAIYVGSFYGDVLQTPSTESGGYVKLDTTARVSFDNLNIDLFVRNLTNEDAFTFRGSYGVALGVGGGDFYGYRLRPRTIGLQLSYDF